MAFLVINLRCLLFLLGLWSFVALSFTAEPPTPTLSPFQISQQENYMKYFKYLSRGINIATASMEDIGREPAKAWKKPIWKDCGTSGTFGGPDFPDSTIGKFQVPNFMPTEYINETVNPYVDSVIYQTIEDLLPLLEPVQANNATKVPKQFALLHDIERFGNRFRETTPSREKTMNALTVIKVEQLKASFYAFASPSEREKKLNSNFTDSVNKLISNNKNFQEDPKSYLSFTNDYGTHYAVEASFGGILMLNTKVAMNNKALKKSKTQLEDDLVLFIQAVVFHDKTIPADAQHSLELFHELVYFGGNASSQKEETFGTEMKFNRTLSRVVVEPLWNLIETTITTTESTKQNLATVVKALQEVEQVQLFRYELYRWKAAFEAAKASEFQETALGYRDVNNLTPYLDYYLKSTTKMPYPERGNETDVWATHLSEMFKWPLEYQIGLRGSLAF